MSVELLAFPNHRNVAGGQRQPDHVRDATHIITDNIMIIFLALSYHLEASRRDVFPMNVSSFVNRLSG